jgi:ubiquinone/menaquinone biosynthesis C-methylase UbiE
MLDYACGDGIITESLMPHFASVVGVDVSGGMLDKYRARVSRIGFGPDQIVSVRGDLLADDVQPTDPPLSDDQLWNFDLVAISMALHHFDKPQVSLQRLAARLKVGGTLLVIDYTPRDGSTRAQKEYEEELQQENKEDGSLNDSQNPDAIAARHTVTTPNGFTEQEMVSLFQNAGCTQFKWKLADRLTPIPVANTKAQLFWARATKL